MISPPQKKKKLHPGFATGGRTDGRPRTLARSRRFTLGGIDCAAAAARIAAAVYAGGARVGRGCNTDG